MIELSDIIDKRQDKTIRADVEEPNMWAFIAPFLAFMIVAMAYPKFDRVYLDAVEQTSELESELESGTVDSQGAKDAIGLEINQGKTLRYVSLVGLQVLIAFGFLFYFRNTYLGQFPFSVSWLAVPVGVVGIVLWVAICQLELEKMLLQPFGMEKYVEVRASFNPYRQIESSSLLAVFIFLRFTVLAVCVPIVEELFLRGWLMRYFENPKWWVISLSAMSFNSLAMGTVYGILTHPGEAFAAAVWFSMVTWLMVRTGKFWDCVVAHSITNLLLGIYILNTGQWHLW